MRAKEFIVEGLWGDLQAMGQAQQAAAMATAKDKMASFRGKLTPQWFKNMSDTVAQARDKQQVETLADQFARAWDNVARQENNRRPAGEAMDVGEYQQTFARWLSNTTQSRLSAETEAALKDTIKTTDTKLVKDFLATAFIPEYLKAKANPVYSIPDGHKVVLDTENPKTGEKMSTTYEWDTTTAGWVDMSTGNMITRGATHAMATRAAMSELSGSKQTSGQSI